MKRKPKLLASFTALYVLWSMLPVAIAVLFSFNSGRSRSTWQGFSLRWYWGDPFSSVWHDDSLLRALRNSLVLAALTILVATPLGVGLALGLTRWRGRPARVANGILLLPLVTPELVVGTALFLVVTNSYTFLDLGRPAQLVGHVTFSLSYVVIVVRGRLLSIGPDLEEAARDLGASPFQAVRMVIVPLLTPAIFASAVLVFATSIDDFVASSLLSSGAGSETVPVKIYGSVRGGATPALNALATIMLSVSMLALVVVFAIMRVMRRRQGDTNAGENSLKELASW
jgi:spermidine/putrescine transport system permease protein